MKLGILYLMIKDDGWFMIQMAGSWDAGIGGLPHYPPNYQVIRKPGFTRFLFGVYGGATIAGCFTHLGCWDVRMI